MENNLNANHRRSLTATLRLIEEMMHEVLDNFHPVQRPIFTHIVNNLSEAEQHRIIAIIREIDHYIIQLKNSYALPEEPRDIEWMLKMRKSKALELLEDTSPKRLQAGGKLDSPIAQKLEKELEELRQLIDKL